MARKLHDQNYESPLLVPAHTHSLIAGDPCYLDAPDSQLARIVHDRDFGAWILRDHESPLGGRARVPDPYWGRNSSAYFRHRNSPSYFRHEFPPCPWHAAAAVMHDDPASAAADEDDDEFAKNCDAGEA